MRLAGRIALVTGGNRGLGLAIVREIVQAHGGGIQVESQVGRGTTMTVLLPIRRAG